MTWAQFSEPFIEKYVPHNLRERLWDEFTYLLLGSMFVFEYETRSYEFDRHTVKIIPTVHKLVCRFVKGLTLLL